MTYAEFITIIDLPVFNINQARLAGLGTDAKFQLWRWVKTGKLVSLKHGWYQRTDKQIEETTLGCMLYQPSYVSLEWVLSQAGVIPEVVINPTLVTTTTTKRLEIGDQVFSYAKIKQDLFWGYETVVDKYDSRLNYRVAVPEKALLDWIYIRKIKRLAEMRVDKQLIRKTHVNTFIKQYPDWVKDAYDTN